MRNRRQSHPLFALWVVAGLAVTAVPATTITGGNIVDQTWSPAGNPYIVQGDVTVPSGAFLVINAGTHVQFASTDGQASGYDANRVELIVNGTLSVAGTAASPVTLQAQSGTTRSIWWGIRADASAASVTIDHALIQHAFASIESTALGTALSVTNTRIDTCAYGIRNHDGSPTLDSIRTSSCTFGFLFIGRGTITLTNAIAHLNRIGIEAAPSTGDLNLTVINSTIDGGGDSMAHGVTALSNVPPWQATVTLQNDIVANNSVGIERPVGAAPSVVNLTYSDVFNNVTSYVNVAPGEGVISANPSYVAPADFHLAAGSPCIDSGSGGVGVPTHDLDGVARPLDGDGIGGAAYDMGAYEFGGSAATILGSVPEGNGGPQPVLTIATPDDGATLDLQWGAACGGSANDYAVYEGTLGTWYSHVPGLCTTSGNLTASFAPSPGSRYYLVVPLDASSEGIYGHASAGPIPVSASACRASQDTAECP